LDLLRKHFGSISIWVDRICINQSDDDERSHQVGLMGLIYRRARTVFIWLGTEDRVGRALRYLDESSEVYRSHGGRRIRVIVADWYCLDALLKRAWWHRAWQASPTLTTHDQC
ncbi:HET-domain-containing protein, partial [Setomelanomma holmii]